MVKRVDSAGERVNERDVKQDSRAEASHNSESDNETDSDFVKKKKAFSDERPSLHQLFVFSFLSPKHVLLIFVHYIINRHSSWRNG